jgi:hypothetical protein
VKPESAAQRLIRAPIIYNDVARDAYVMRAILTSVALRDVSRGSPELYLSASLRSASVTMRVIGSSGEGSKPIAM